MKGTTALLNSLSSAFLNMGTAAIQTETFAGSGVLTSTARHAARSEQP